MQEITRHWTQRLPNGRPSAVLDVMPNFRTTRMTTNIWIEKGWGDSVENATFDDIKSAIEETIRMDEEHRI